MMQSERPFSFKRTDLLGLSLSLVFLLPCLYYCYQYLNPSVGFILNLETWEVRSVDACKGSQDCLEVGDQVLSIGGVTFEEYTSSRTVPIFSAFGDADVVPVRIRRGGEERAILVQAREGMAIFWRLATLNTLFPLMFWSMGTLAVLFLRPRDHRWWLLVLFYYTTALWFSSGLASWRQVGYSAVVFHVSIWLFIPLVIHLHLILPRPLLTARVIRGLLIPLYAISLAIMLADVLELLSQQTYLGFFLSAILAALGLLLLRFFLRLPAAAVVANRIMAFGVALGFTPLVLFYVLPVVLPQIDMPDSQAHPFYPWAAIIPLLTLPIWPLSYFYAIYKHHLGTLEFRANRLLGVYSFYSLYITGYVVVLFLVSSYGKTLVDGRSIATTLAVSLAFVSGAPLVRRRFQVMIDRYVFGIKHTPEEVIGLVAERIPRAFDREILARTIVDEILPTLLIRQSALHLFEDGRLETLYTQALPPGAWEPEVAELRALADQTGCFLPPRTEPSTFGWVRLVVPLAIQEETIGLWLIGRRDPDDYFPREDIDLLWTLANQIAPVMENIRLYERAQQEISQRRAAEQEIRKSEERFRNLFEATLEGIAIVRGGVILEVNRALLEIFGYSPPELIGRPLSELITRPELIAQGEIQLGSGPREGVGCKRDGSTVDIEIAVKSYVFQGEDVTVVAIRDITRRKRDEAENKMLQQQLLQSQKMEAIGRLSAGVAHDFNNCLLAIFGYSDLLLARVEGDELLRRNLVGIKEAGQKAASLTKQLLAFTRQQPMEARVMDLNQVVSGIEKMLQRLIGEDVRLSTRLTSGLPPVKIDPGQMEQVIMNLAVNSRDAMPGGGDLTLTTGLCRIDGVGVGLPHVQMAEGPYVLLTVKDTGVGMDAETRSRVFEPFFTTKKIGEGTGLGLSTAYGIVKQSRGYIFVDSAPSAGATFSIYLPPAVEEEGGEAAEADALPGPGSETILLVEDEREARAVLRQILTGRGYTVLEAGSGKQALSLAKGHDDTIHLLLTDLTMPGMGGSELANQVLQARPSIRVLYMSGYNEEPLRSPGPSGAVPVCLQKPFSAETLAQAVREALDGR